MHPKRAEIDQRVRKLVPIGIGLGILLVIGLWVGYFYNAGREVTGKNPSVWTSPYPWLALALVTTLVGPPVMFVSVRNYIWLIRHGTEVQGYVKSVSPLSKSGARPVTYRYSVNGVEYTMKRDTPTMYADNYAPGTPVLMLVDPDKPKRATVLESAT
jgi:hypothetical protein